MITSIWNVKGGVGKTLTSINLAAGFAKEGKKTLLVDMDGQSSVSYLLFPEREFDDGDLTIVDALAGTGEISECIYHTNIENLDVIPATIYLFTVEKQMLVNTSSGIQQTKLKKLLKKLQGYDEIIIDNNPSINLCTTNALCACDRLIIPADLEKGALKGIELTLQHSQEILENIDGANFEIRILPTKIQRNKIDTETLEELKMAYGSMVYQTNIRYQAAPIKDSSMRGRMLINDMKSRSKVAQDYRDLVAEVLQEEK